MNFKSNSQNAQSTVQSDAAANWQNFIVEDLSDEAQAAVSGGGGEDWEIHYNRAMRKAKNVITAPSTPMSWEQVLEVYYANPGAMIG